MTAKGVAIMLMIIVLNLAGLIWWTECLIDQEQRQSEGLATVRDSRIVLQDSNR